MMTARTNKTVIVIAIINLLYLSSCDDRLLDATVLLVLLDRGLEVVGLTLLKLLAGEPSVDVALVVNQLRDVGDAVGTLIVDHTLDRQVLEHLTLANLSLVPRDGSLVLSLDLLLNLALIGSDGRGDQAELPVRDVVGGRGNQQVVQVIALSAAVDAASPGQSLLGRLLVLGGRGLTLHLAVELVTKLLSQIGSRQATILVASLGARQPTVLADRLGDPGQVVLNLIDRLGGRATLNLVVLTHEAVKLREEGSHPDGTLGVVTKEILDAGRANLLQRAILVLDDVGVNAVADGVAVGAVGVRLAVLRGVNLRARHGANDVALARVLKGGKELPTVKLDRVSRNADDVLAVGFLVDLLDVLAHHRKLDGGDAKLLGNSRLHVSKAVSEDLVGVLVFAHRFIIAH
jgi:hypothetical protein